MGRPINKRNFSADANNNIKVQFHNGSASVAGYIVKQKGSKKFVVKEFDGSTTYTCQLVAKASGDLAAGEMSITVKNDAGTAVQVTKISAHRITAGGVSYAWNYSTSTTDGAVQIEEAGTDTSGSGATDLEGDDVVLPVWTINFAGYTEAYFTGTVLQLGTNFGTYTPLSTENAALVRALTVGDTIRIAGAITPTETYDRVITNITEAGSGAAGQFQISFSGGLPHSSGTAEGTISALSLL